MIFIASKNDIFPLPEQHSPGIDNWQGDDIDSSQFLSKKSDTLLQLLQRKEYIKKEKPKSIVNELNILIVEKDKIINKELFKK